MTSAVVSSLGIIAVSIGTALVGIFGTFVNVYKNSLYESMAILIRGKTREIHGWYLFRKTKIQKTQVENGHTPTFLNSNSIQNFVDVR